MLGGGRTHETTILAELATTPVTPPGTFKGVVVVLVVAVVVVIVVPV